MNGGGSKAKEGKNIESGGIGRMEYGGVRGWRGYFWMGMRRSMGRKGRGI